MKPSLTIRIREWRYWYLRRHLERFVPWVARKLPNNVKYWVVIHGMVNVEPDRNPSMVTGMDLLNYFEKGK